MNASSEEKKKPDTKEPKGIRPSLLKKTLSFFCALPTPGSLSCQESSRKQNSLVYIIQKDHRRPFDSAHKPIDPPGESGLYVAPINRNGWGEWSVFNFVQGFEIGLLLLLLFGFLNSIYLLYCRALHLFDSF